MNISYTSSGNHTVRGSFRYYPSLWGHVLPHQCQGIVSIKSWFSLLFRSYLFSTNYTIGNSPFAPVSSISGRAMNQFKYFLNTIDSSSGPLINCNKEFYYFLLADISHFGYFIELLSTLLEIHGIKTILLVSYL